MVIGGHQAQGLDGTHVQLDAGLPAIAAAGIVEHEGLGGRTEVVGEDGTVVGTVETGETLNGTHAPVADAHIVEHLVVDVFGGHREGERGGQLIVDGNGALPHLRHLEVGVDGRDGRGNRALASLDIGGEAHLDEFLAELGSAVGEAVAAEGAEHLVHAAVFLLDSSRQVVILGRGTELCLILHHTAVGGQVGEEHEGQTAREETRTTTHLERLVAKDVVVETYTGRDGDVAAGPLAGVDLAAVVVEFLDGSVGEQVVVVEEDTVETDTCRHFQTVGGVPLILHIGTQLVELHTGSGLGLIAVAVGETNHLGSGLVEEVIDALVAVIAGTVAHIGIVGHLVLIAQTTHQLVVAVVVGHVILHVPNRVVNGIVVGEELIA